MNLRKFDLNFWPHVNVDGGQLLLLFGPDLFTLFVRDSWLTRDLSHGVRSQRPGMVQENCCWCRGNKMSKPKAIFMPYEEHPRTYHQYPCSRCLKTYAFARKGRRVHPLGQRPRTQSDGPLELSMVLNLDSEEMSFTDDTPRRWVW